MNIILLDTDDIENGIPRSDNRYRHITRILKLSEGESFKSGFTDGTLGTAIITEIKEKSIMVNYNAEEKSPEPYTLHMVIGHVRPPTAQRLIKDLTAFGIGKLSFIYTELTEKSYTESNLWKKDKYKQFLIEGCQQGGLSIVPEIDYNRSLGTVLKEADKSTVKIFMDLNSEVSSSIPALNSSKEVMLFIGPERGWTEEERALLMQNGALPLYLLPRILRTESCCSAAAALILQKMGIISSF